MEWTTALPDWEKRIVARRSLVPVKPLFPAVAEDAMSVFSELRMVDADGSPTMGEACLPWVTDIVQALFGSYDPVRKRRLITNYFLMVSKKNGKSMIAAAVMLTALILNTRRSGEFIILAPTKEAADNAYKPIREMILADEELTARFAEQQHIKTVTCRLTRATLKVVAADSATVTGKKAIGVFVDELWEFGKHAKAAAMLTEATGGITSRPEGFVVYCTTQSDAPPAGVFLDKLTYARKVRDGKVVDPRFLPVIYEFPQHMLEAKAYEDLANAYITNPNWGVSVDAEVIAQKIQEAREAGEHAVRDIQAKHLNVQIGMAMGASRWTGADFWLAAATDDAVGSLEELIERCEVISLGIDGGGLDDLLGFAAVGREAETGRWLSWTRAWIHPIAMERRLSEVSKYQDFINDGDLVLVKRIGQDLLEVVALVVLVVDSGLLDRIGVDRAGLGGIFDALVGTDDEPGPVEKEMVIGIPQGWQLQGAIKTAERRLAGGTLVPAISPLMVWCVGNAKVVQVQNAISINKQVSGLAKIDPLMALFDAIYLMALNPEAKSGPGIYSMELN